MIVVVVLLLILISVYDRFISLWMYLSPYIWEDTWLDSCFLCARSAFGRLATACLIHTHTYAHASILRVKAKTLIQVEIFIHFSLCIYLSTDISIETLEENIYDVFINRKKNHRFIGISNQSAISILCLYIYP